MAGSGQEWPFIDVAGFETYGRDFLKASHAELSGVFPKVDSNMAARWIDFANTHVEKNLHENHMLQKGSLERLADINMTQYHPFMSKPVSKGVFEEDEERDTYWPNWYFTPPPSTYGYVSPWYHQQYTLNRELSSHHSYSRSRFLFLLQNGQLEPRDDW